MGTLSWKAEFFFVAVRRVLIFREISGIERRICVLAGNRIYWNQRFCDSEAVRELLRQESEAMAGTVGIGNQDFEVIRKGGYFYVDKTSFIRQWWEGGDQVTLITRPRRFGKTLNMSMVEKFFSLGYAGREDLFLGLKIWEDEGFRKLQGSYPVLLISFADVKESCFLQTRKKICTIIRELYGRHRYLLKGDMLSKQEKQDFQNISADIDRKSVV